MYTSLHKSFEHDRCKPWSGLPAGEFRLLRWIATSSWPADNELQPIAESRHYISLQAMTSQWWYQRLVSIVAARGDIGIQDDVKVANATDQPKCKARLLEFLGLSVGDRVDIYHSKTRSNQHFILLHCPQPMRVPTHPRVSQWHVQQRTWMGMALPDLPHAQLLSHNSAGQSRTQCSGALPAPETQPPVTAVPGLPKTGSQKSFVAHDGAHPVSQVQQQTAMAHASLQHRIDRAAAGEPPVLLRIYCTMHCAAPA